jgi:L-iditol 2-dehydrogenase
MKVGVLGAGRVRLAEAPEPAAGPSELVVELAACGICGTDLEKLRGNYTTTAGILGHEAVGAVAGPAAPPEGFRWGDRVFVHHHVPCGRCAICRRGDTTFCPEYGRSNLDPGGFAERFRVSAEHVRRGAALRLDPAVSWEAGTLLEPAGCARTALRAVRLPPDATVLIVGLGPVGQLYGRLARALGASWIGGAEVSAPRRAVAERTGFDAVADSRAPDEVAGIVRDGTAGVGVDLAVVATGAPAAVELAGPLARPGGTLNLFGLPAAGTRLPMDLQRLYLRGLRVVPTYATTEADLAEVHALLVAGRVTLDDLVSHRFPLDRIEEAFALAGRPEEAMKVVVTGPGFAGAPGR